MIFSMPKDCKESSWGFRDKEDQYPPMVFANNTDIVTDFFYIIYNYSCYFDYTEYDIWQIDTLKLNAEWYVDLNLFASKEYVCTPFIIPVEALQLFHLGNRICSRCGHVDWDASVGQVLSNEGPQRFNDKWESYNRCCYSDVADMELTQKYRPIEEVVEQFGRYRLRR